MLPFELRQGEFDGVDLANHGQSDIAALIDSCFT